MPAPSYIPNSPSGIDSKAVIDKLVSIERIPQRRMEKEQAELRAKNAALQELIKSTKRLQSKLKKLYGFEAKFEAKKVEFSREGFASGIANKDASPGVYKIKINRLAKKLIFKSRDVETNEKIPSGSIEINGKKKKFTGGKLEDFVEFLNNHYKDILNVKYIRPNEKSALALTETVNEGEDALLDIKDPDGIMQSLGMISQSTANQKNKPKTDEKNKPDQKETEKQEIQKDIIFKLENFALLHEGPFQIDESKKKITLSELSSRRFDQKPEIKQGEILKGLDFEYSTVKKKKTQTDDAPYSIKDGPTESVNVKGIKLETYNIERTRGKDEDSSKEEDYGIIVYYQIDNNEKNKIEDNKTQEEQKDKDGEKKSVDIPEKEIISLKDKDKLVRIHLKATVQHIDIYTKNTTFSIQNAKWVFDQDPNYKPDQKEKSKEDKFKDLEKQYPNLVQKAGTAFLELDGIEINRNRNNGIDDLIKGASLNLLQETKDPIQMEIKRNSEDSMKEVQEFIQAYNELMQISYELTKTSEINRVGDYDKMKNESGILIGNSGIRSMMNGLKYRVSDSYPAVREPYIKALPFIGIHTGEIGASWKSINKGYLKLDEEKFRKMVLKHPTAVKEFFGIDTNADRKLDHGLAFKMHEFLEPYTQFTRGIYNSQIELNKRRITSLNKEIDRQERHVKVYREKLKLKFGTMEGKVRQQKSIGKFIDQRLGNRK